MEKSIKFLALFILIGCLLISASNVFSTIVRAKSARYYISRSPEAATLIFDNWTGKYYSRNTQGPQEVDAVSFYRDDRLIP